MKFHGVGDPTSTAAEATALQFARDLLSTVCRLLISTPVAVASYKKRAAAFRALAGCLDALGHALEILASMLSHTAALLYAGPIVCTLGGTMGGATRAVILQHFAEGGISTRLPDYGDISLKESNQDKGGKIIGLMIGYYLLTRWVGSSSGGRRRLTPTANAESEQSASVEARAFGLFLVLSVVHVAFNGLAVLQLRLRPPPAPARRGPGRRRGR